MKTVLVTDNLASYASIPAVVRNGTPNAFAGVKGSTARTLIRNIPDDFDIKKIPRMLDLWNWEHTTNGGRSDDVPSVFDFSEISKHAE